MTPFSDLDLILLHPDDTELPEEVVSEVWYPIWDAKYRLDYAVRTRANSAPSPVPIPPLASRNSIWPSLPETSSWWTPPAPRSMPRGAACCRAISMPSLI
nr:hypothetical protein [Corynebacterium guaraldiae]